MLDSRPTSAASANDTPPHKMVKFVGSDSAGLPLKRKQVSQACLSCRRRKKRCTHQDDDPAAGGAAAPATCGHGAPNPASPMRRRPFSPSGSGGVAPPPPRRRPPPSQVPTPPTSSGGGGSSSSQPEKQPSRFVGDLSPEQFLIEATSPHSSRDLSVRGGVGVWQGKRSTAAVATTHPVGGSGSADGGGGGGATGGDGGGSRAASAHDEDPDHDASRCRRLARDPSGLLRDLLVAHVRTHCLPCVPPAREWAALRALYRRKVDPLFPALSRQVAATTTTTDASAASPSVADVVVRQAVSLAAAADPEAAGHLRLAPGGPLLDRDEFRAQLAAALTATLDAGLLADRLLAVRLLLVLSLFVQPTAPDEADLPSGLFARASHQFQTLGYHIGAVHNAAAATASYPPHGNKPAAAAAASSASPAADDDYAEVRTLFCCTWALDKLTAAFYGRAEVLHERDVGWDVDACIAAQAPPFRFFLGVVRLLEDVIGLYRPSKKLEDHDPVPRYIDLPISEQMMLAAGATDVASPLLATVEVFYHAVAILSSRPTSTSTSASTPHDAQPPPGSTATAAAAVAASSLFPARATNSRRSHAADRILDILTSEFPLGSGGGGDGGPGLPQLSYLPILPFAVSLALGVAYRKMRYSAVPMFRARGRRAFAAHTALLQQLGASFWMARSMGAMADQVRREMDKALVAALSSQQQQQKQQQQQQEPQQQQQPPVSSAPGPEPGAGARSSPVGPEATSTASQQLPRDDVDGVLAATAGGPKDTAIATQIMSPPPVGTTATPTTTFSALPPDLLAPWPQPTVVGGAAAAAMDVFDHFDPAFDLDAVDAAIEGSLDIGASSNWFDWQQEWGFPQ